MLFAYEHQLLTLATGVSMASDFYSAEHQLVGWELGSIAIQWVGASATTARAVVEISIDGLDWCAYSAEADSMRVDKATGCAMTLVEPLCFSALRVHFLKKTESTGTITIKSFVKRPRVQ